LLNTLSGVSQDHGTTLGMSLFLTPQLLHGWELTHGRMVHCTIRHTKRSVFKTKEAQTRKTPCEISHEDILNTFHTADEVHWSG